MSKQLLYIAILAVLLGACSNKQKPLFQLLPADKTGIHFSNRITENDTFNILAYEYVYNGGGVGIGDFNNDGLQDVFFTGNMVGNQLYLNEGNFKFKDITETAGVAAKNRWNSGVAVVDINNDGWLDLYVCATTYQPGSRRANSLFINNGGKSVRSPQSDSPQSGATGGLRADGLKTVDFTEMAAEYGIADTSHTTNAAFFDYDNDGDLDLYLLINQMDEKKVPNIYRPKITDGSSKRTDKLFRNDYDEKLGHAVFTDVSKEAGILIEGFGLGLNICDINQDGWKDIYVTNDYLTNDLLWINSPQSSVRSPQSGAATMGHAGDRGLKTVDSQKRTFIDKAATYFKHTSHSAMGNDVVDLNNDGLPDIVAVDMLPEDNLRRKTMLMPNNYNSYLNNDKYGYQYQYVRNTLQLNQGFTPRTEGGKGGAADPIFSEISMFSGISSTDWSWTPLVADFDNDGYRDVIITNGFPNDVTDRDFIDYNSEKGNYLTKKELRQAIPSVKIKNYAFRNESGSPTVHSPQSETTGVLRTEDWRLKTQKLPTFQSMGEAWGMTQTSFSNGAAYADFDNDGDLDYIVNNINDSAFVFKNTFVETHPDSANWLNIKFKGSEKNRNGLGAIVEIFYGGKKQVWENTPYRGYLSSVETGAHFGLGKTTSLDSVVVTWQSENQTGEGKRQVLKNVPAKQTLTVDIANATTAGLPTAGLADYFFTDATASLGINFIHPESDYIDFNVQRLLPHKLSQFGPAIAVGDVNGDGLDDFYVSGSHFNKGKFFIQTADGQFVAQDLLPPDSYRDDGDAKVTEELGSLLFDADGDGDNDLYLATGGYEFDLSDTCYQDQLFLNENGHFVLAKDALPKLLSSGSCAKAADFDRDGDLDIFVGGRVLPFQYPMPVSSYLLRNDTPLKGGAGEVKFTVANKDAAPGLENIGLVCDALWTDYDNDGWQDLLVAGEWMPLQFFHNEKGKLIPQSAIRNLQSAIGWWNSLVAADFDLDGDMDYIAGNLGTNTLLKADDEHPIGVYAADFDGNKSEMTNPAAEGNVGGNRGLDALPSAWFPDKDGKLTEFPFFGRADMDKQLVKMKKLYLYHRDYGQANMASVMKNFPDAKPLILKANYLKTSYIENLGSGNFALREMPTAAQLAPVFGMVTGDFNGDNLPDLLLTGNDFGTETGMGHSDALNGLLLLGDGKGNFTPTTMQQSGICIPGDGKSLVRLQGKDGASLFAAGQNKGPLMVFKNAKSGGQSVALKPSDCAAIITLSDGKKYREELPYGHGFLSQSARRLWLPAGAVSYEIIDYQGKKRQSAVRQSDSLQ